MGTPRRWPGSGRMWVEICLVVLAVGLVWGALSPGPTELNPESPETDGESIDAVLQVAGAMAVFVAAVVLVAIFELTWLVIRALRARSDTSTESR